MVEQIKELRQFMNHMDEKIRQYRKQGRDPGRLIENKARAAETIEQLKTAKNGDTKPLQKNLNASNAKYEPRF